MFRPLSEVPTLGRKFRQVPETFDQLHLVNLLSFKLLIHPNIHIHILIQMARDTKGKGQATSSEIESPVSSDSEETRDATPPRARIKRKAVATKVPKRAQGRGRPNPEAHRLRMKRATVPGAQMDDDDLHYLEHWIIRMPAPINRTGAQYNGHRTVNYMKGKNQFENLRFENYHGFEKEQKGDFRFWMWFHSDWYESVIMTKTHPTTEMKSINWSHLDELDMPVVAEAISACERMNMQ